MNPTPDAPEQGHREFPFLSCPACKPSLPCWGTARRCLAPVKALPTPDTPPAPENVTAILDAAVEVAVFSRTHNWPKENSVEFADFAQKLDALSTALGKKFPYFNRRINTILHGND